MMKNNAFYILTLFSIIPAFLQSQATEYVYLKDSILLEGKLVRYTNEGIFKFREHGATDFFVLNPNKTISFGNKGIFEYQAQKVHFQDSTAYVFLRMVEEGIFALHTDIQNQRFFIENEHGDFFYIPKNKTARKSVIANLLGERAVLPIAPNTFSNSGKAAKKIWYFLNHPERRRFPAPVLSGTFSIGGSLLTLSEYKRDQLIFFRKTNDYLALGFAVGATLELPINTKGNLYFVQAVNLQNDYLFYKNSTDVEFLDYSAAAFFLNFEPALKRHFFFKKTDIHFLAGFGVSSKLMERNEVKRTVIVANERINSSLNAFNFYGNAALYPVLKAGVELPLNDKKWVNIALAYRLRIFKSERPNAFVNSYQLELALPF